MEQLKRKGNQSYRLRCIRRSWSEADTSNNVGQAVSFD